MDTKSIQLLERLAPQLHTFFELADTEQDCLLPLIAKNIQSTIKILKLIEHKELTYFEIADIVELHHNTVRQKLLALKRGGFRVYLDENIAILETGRKRTLAKY